MPEKDPIMRELMESAPDRIKDLASRHDMHQLRSDEEDVRGDQQFNIRLPFSDLREWIYEEDSIYKAFEAFPIWRLSRIRQLSFLAYIGPNPEIQFFHEFNHNRLEHSLLVAKIMETVLRRNGASDQDLIVGVTAGIIHDQATPALGDATKKIDPDRLNEEDNWAKVVDETGWAYLQKIGATEEEINDIVHNRGILGKVLDIADRIGYVMVDVGQLVSLEGLESIINGYQETGYRADIAKLLLVDTMVGDIYRDIGINWETGEVYFRNPDRLSKFLELRALLNKFLYQHPVSQARDFMVANSIRPFYDSEGKNGTVGPDQLIKMDDRDLLLLLSGENAEERYSRLYQAFVSWFPQYYSKLDTKEDLGEKRREIEQDERLVVLGEIESKGFNPATDYLVLNDKGQIVPFEDYDPDCAQRIQRIARSTKGHILFWQKRGQRDDLKYNADLVRDFPTNFIPIL